MKLFRKMIVLVMALATLPSIGVLGNLPSTDIVSSVETYADDTDTAKATQLLELVNSYRQENGLEPFNTCQVMDTMASVRATEVTDGVYLNRPDGSYYGTIFTEYGVSTSTFNQNSYYGTVGYDTPEQAFESFKANDRHNGNMLSTAYNYIGIGVYTLNGKTYYYQLFCYSDTLVPDAEVTTTATETSTTTEATTTTTAETTTEVTTTTEDTTTVTTTEATTQVTLSDEELRAKYNLDVNNDGFVNVIDLTIIKKYVLGILYY
jgi:uncharacterized protein YkwD